jgi:hypothetical protein
LELLVLIGLTFSCSSNAEQSVTSQGCAFSDNTYHAIVDYYNPKTDYRTKYDLDVAVKNCMVVQINFPNGGHLDSDHITIAPLDDKGNAKIYGEEGKTYTVGIISP